MADGVFRYAPKPIPAKRRRRNVPAPLVDAAEDHEWLRAHPYRLARVHRIQLGSGYTNWPVFIIACRVHDICSEDGWRPAWLEIADGPYSDEDAPSFATQDWEIIVREEHLFAEAKRILAVINHAARTRPDAMLIRDMLVALRSAELGHEADDFEFIENV